MPVYLMIEFICLFTGLILFKANLKTKTGRLILFYVAVSVITDFIGYLIAVIYKTENGILFNFYDVFKYLFLFSFFRFQLNSLNNYLFSTGLILYIVSLCYDISILQSPHDLMIYSTITGDLMLVFISLSFFRQLLLKPEFENVLFVPDFWVSIAVLIYFLGVLPYHLSWKFLVFKNVDASGKLYVILLAILIALHYLAFTVSFLLWKFQRKI